MRFNSIGCYMLNGNDTIMFPDRTKSDDFCRFLVEVREHRICLILDNFPTHKAQRVMEKAQDLNIKLIFCRRIHLT